MALMIEVMVFYELITLTIINGVKRNSWLFCKTNNAMSQLINPSPF
jgi:hypothetical protein